MLIDVHGSGAGYVASPADGTLRDVVASTARLAEGVYIARRLGVSVEYATQARAGKLTFAWGGPWVDALPRGLRHSLPETVDAAIVQGLARCGMSWLCLGATVSHGNIVRLTEVGVTLGLGHAVEVGAGALQWLETGAAARVTVEGLPHCGCICCCQLRHVAAAAPCDSPGVPARTRTPRHRCNADR